MRFTTAALLLSAAIPCQASVATFGAGCSLQTPVPSQAPSIGSTGLPQLGQTFSITYQGPNYTFSSAQQTAQPVLALGTQAIGVTLPTFGLIYQPTNCTAYLAPVSLTPMAVNPALPEYETDYPITVPNTAGLIGYQFLAQWLLVHTQCGIAGCDFSGLVTSDAAVITVGQ